MGKSNHYYKLAVVISVLLILMILGTINAQGTPTLTPSNVVIDTGQYASFTATPNGATNPIQSVQFFNVTGNSIMFLPANWIATNSYPINIVEEATCVPYNGNVYCLGGQGQINGNFQILSGTYFAPILPSGSLGTWSTTSNYPISNEIGTSCITYSNNIYCVGGWDFREGGVTADVYYAPVLGSNSLGVWTATNSYPVVTASSACVVNSNVIYCMTSSTEYYAPIFSSGVVGSWTYTNSIGIGSFVPCVTSGNYIYCVGGIGNGNGYSYRSTYYAPILSDHSLGAWALSRLYPPDFGTLHSGNGNSGPVSCVTAINAIYCMGTSGNINFQNDSYYAPLLGSAGIGNWTPLNPNYDVYGTNIILVDGPQLCVTYGNYIPYVACISGEYDYPITSTWTNSVFYTALLSNSLTYPFVVNSPTPGNVFNYSVTIIDGANSVANSITNSITVNPALQSISTYPYSLRVSNTFTVAGGEYEFSTSNFIGGTGPYTFNYVIIDNATNTVLQTNVFAACSITTNTFQWQVPNSFIGKKIDTNVIITDSASTPNVANSFYHYINSFIQVVNQNLAVTNLLVSNSIADSGQTETLTVVTNGVTNPIKNITFWNVTGNRPLAPTNYLPWIAANAYPKNITRHSCVGYNNNIYCIGGFNSMAYTGGTGSGSINSVYYAPILSNNALGAWIQGNDITEGTEYSDCITSSNNIYCIGTTLGGGPLVSATYYAPILSSNAVGAWVGTNAFPLITEAQPTCFAYNNNAYCIMQGTFVAGYSSNTFYYAPIFAGGGLGAWTAVANSLPVPISSSRPSPVCTLVSNNIYCFGNGKEFSYFAPILSTNAIGNWSITTNMPYYRPNEPYFNLSDEKCLTLSNNIYCISADYSGNFKSLYAEVFNSGQLSGWITTNTEYNNTISGIYGAPCLTNANNIYCVGGTFPRGQSNAVYYATPTNSIPLNSLTYSFTLNTSVYINSFNFNTFYYGYNAIINDSTPSTITSITNSVLVNPNPFVGLNPAYTNYITSISNVPVIDAGQYELITANFLGGTGPLFSLNYTISNTYTNVVIASQLYNGITIGTNSFLWQSPLSSAGNFVHPNLTVTDFGTTNPFSVTGGCFFCFPDYGGNITINNALGIPTLIPSNYAIIVGNTETFSILLNGGTSPFTINFFNITGSNVIANVVYPAAWTNLVNNFPQVTSYGSCVTSTNNIYCIGGSNGRSTFSNITYYAPVLPGGSIGTWTTNAFANNYIYEIGGQSCVVYNSTTFAINNIYCMAGQSDGPLLFGDLNSTAFAPILSDGSVGNWINVTNETINFEGQSCVAYSNTVLSINNIYCIGGSEGDAFYPPFYWTVNLVDYVPIFPSNGFLGNWINDSNNYPLNVSYGSCLLNTNNIYCIGGVIYQGRVNSNATYYAPILSDGSVGPWSTTSNYPFNISSESCINDNAIIFCTGGIGGGFRTDINATYYAQINPDGTVGNWISTFNAPSTAHSGLPSIYGTEFSEGQSCITLSNNIYCIGGVYQNEPPTVGFSTPITSNVSYAHLSNTGLVSTLPTFSFVVNAAVTTAFQYNLTVTDSAVVNETANSLTQNILVCSSVPCTSTTTTSASTTSTTTVGSTTSSTSTTAASTTSTTSSTTTVATTTTGGGGGGGTGGGGGGGGGSPSGPTVTKLNATCDLITNMSVLNSVSFTVNGANHTVVDNYISSNFTSVIVNGITYVLTLGARQTIPSLSLSLLLQSVSYAPILHTVNVIACSTSPATTATTTTVTTSTYIPTKSTTSTSTTATTTKCQGNGSKACRGSSTTATTTIIPNVTTHLDYFIPITIYNYQNASTVHNFDQMIVINSSKYAQYEAANLQNILFYYQNKTIIPSWLEMNNTSSSRSTTYWVKLAEQIPAHSNITIYMGFANKTSVLFNPTTTGEAPQLTNNYAQYDDGKNVFPLYDNFVGNKLSKIWKAIGTGKYKVSNGLTIEGIKQSNGKKSKANLPATNVTP